MEKLSNKNSTNPTPWTNCKSDFLAQLEYTGKDVYSSQASGDNSHTNLSIEMLAEKRYLPFKEDCIEIIVFFARNFQHTDVKVSIGDKQFDCHMFLLKHYCKYFQDKQKLANITLPSDKIAPIGFSLAYEWMLDDFPHLKRKGFMELFRAARFLEMHELISQCWAYLDNESFPEEVIFKLYSEAQKIGLRNDLMELMLRRVTVFFLELVSSQEFLELTLNEVVFLLRSNRVCINNEMEILYSAIHWISYKWEERKVGLIDLIRSVRFHLMPVWMLGKLMHPCDVLEVNRVICQPGVQSIIRDALTDVSVQSTSGTELKETLLSSTPCRNWAYDKRCRYHHLPHCTKKIFMSYEGFLKYLVAIEKLGSKYKGSLQPITDEDAMRKCCETN